jgi:hypothetical protein
VTDNRPRKGDTVSYKGEKFGIVSSVEREICWVDYPSGTDCFIWKFKDGLNTLHDWPTKHIKE